MILDYTVIDYSNIDDKIDKLYKFINGIYIPSFPDENEREPVENIVRYTKNKTGFRTITVIAYHENHMVGGEMIDIHPSCNAIHITYLCVEKNQRNKKYGETILRQATALVCEICENNNIGINNIFFETEFSGKEKSWKMCFFQNCGGMVVPIKYYQPPLSKGLGWVDNMFLCIFCFKKTDSGYILGMSIDEKTKADSIVEFLRNFYKVLGYTEKNSEKLKNMIFQLKEKEDKNTGLLELVRPVSLC